ncbi:MAG: 4-hydroxybenzoate octaprenyltransferase [Planctomycetes bacterium]|nr:4-hydroxybenzoate octaprenyltransferase [Planctomycetota bacterium]
MSFSIPFKKISSLLELIKFSHTIFSVPFAIMSAFIAADGMPTFRQLILIAGALAMARSAAMSFNRIVDVEFDIHNPRTAYRVELQKKIGKKNVWIFTLVCMGLFVTFAGLLNRLALYMSPVAILIVFGYSFTKRFTDLSHFVLGLALALSPIGAWIGIQGRFGITPFLLAFAVVLWTAGFDIIYACQDIEHDKKLGLHSLPKRIGLLRALILSGILHFFMVVALFVVPRYSDMGIIYSIGVCVTAALLFYEHLLVKPKDLSKINTAFFTVNGTISMGLMGVTLIDIFI